MLKKYILTIEGTEAAFRHLDLEDLTESLHGSYLETLSFGIQEV